MQIERDELIKIITQEIEKVRGELVDGLANCLDDDLGGKEESVSDCLAGIGDTLDDAERLRAFDKDMSDGEYLGTDKSVIEGKPYKTQLQKLKTKQRQEREKDQERRRAARYGGQAVMDLLGITEDDEDPESRKRHFKDCDDVPGNVKHSADTGRFASKSDKDASKSLYFACKTGSRRVDSSGSKAKNVHRSGRGKKRDKGSGQYRVRDNSRKYEGKIRKNPSLKQLCESFESWVNESQEERQAEPTSKYTTRDLNRIEFLIKDELNKMLQTYAKTLSDQQRAAFKNTTALSDAKLSVFSNSFGYTSLMGWLKESGAIDRLVKRIAERLSPSALGNQEPQSYQQGVKSKASSFADEKTIDPFTVDKNV